MSISEILAAGCVLTLLAVILARRRKMLLEGHPWFAFQLLLFALFLEGGLVHVPGKADPWLLRAAIGCAIVGHLKTLFRWK